MFWRTSLSLLKTAVAWERARGIGRMGSLRRSSRRHEESKDGRSLSVYISESSLRIDIWFDVVLNVVIASLNCAPERCCISKLDACHPGLFGAYELEEAKF